MQRYRSINDVKLNDRILFDNSTAFINDLPYINLVGKVVGFSTGDNIKVEFYHGEVKISSIPYYLAQ